MAWRYAFDDVSVAEDASSDRRSASLAGEARGAAPQRAQRGQRAGVAARGPARAGRVAAARAAAEDEGEDEDEDADEGEDAGEDAGEDDDYGYGYARGRAGGEDGDEDEDGDEGEGEGEERGDDAPSERAGGRGSGRRAGARASAAEPAYEEASETDPAETRRAATKRRLEAAAESGRGGKRAQGAAGLPPAPAFVPRPRPGDAPWQPLGLNASRLIVSLLRAALRETLDSERAHGRAQDRARVAAALENTLAAVKERMDTLRAPPQNRKDTRRSQFEDLAHVRDVMKRRARISRNLVRTLNQELAAQEAAVAELVAKIEARQPAQPTALPPFVTPASELAWLLPSRRPARSGAGALGALGAAGQADALQLGEPPVNGASYEQGRASALSAFLSASARAGSFRS